MFFVTNRKLNLSSSGYELLTKVPNEKGPNELSVVEILGPVGNPSVSQVPDELSKAKSSKYIKDFNLELDKNDTQYASLLVACEVFRKSTKEKKNVLLFVHGYNNDTRDIYKTALEIESLYGVLVVVFSWPSNGGGVVSGGLSYLSDKRDARASQDALNRVIDKIGKYHDLLTVSMREKLSARITNNRRLESNPTKQREEFAKLLQKECDLSINLLCHSMGNYVLKHALGSSLSEAKKLVFDNVILAAADTNNENHADWVDQLQMRGCLYICINENDYALSWSRRKPGENQKARLGHYLKLLNSEKAYYIDFTRERGVGKSHSYFGKDTVKSNKGVERFFKSILNGGNASRNLDYDVRSNTSRPK